jgi:hypothetical protein
MDDGTDLPDHLSDGPTIEDANFIFDGFSPSEISEIHTAVTNLTAEFSSLADPHTTRYFILGNYDDRPKGRLYAAKRILQETDPQSVTLLLDDLDPENDDWENFYLKFRYTLTLIDYPVLIAEDNDGGHELELGELPLPKTYVAKRDYEDFSINHDLEREKYDAMIAKLFELLERNDRLFTWTDRDSFEHAVRAIAEQTRA